MQYCIKVLSFSAKMREISLNRHINRKFAPGIDCRMQSANGRMQSEWNMATFDFRLVKWVGGPSYLQSGDRRQAGFAFDSA